MELTPEISNFLEAVIERTAKRIARENTAQKLRTTLPFNLACDVLNISRAKGEKLIKDGKLETKKIGGSVYVTIRSIEKIQKPD